MSPTAPDLSFPQPDPSGLNHKAAADPPLGAGFFIEPTITTDNNHCPLPRPSSSGGKNIIKPKRGNQQAGMQAPPSSSANGTKAEAPNHARRKGPEAGGAAAAAAANDTQSWLPPGWIVEDRVRSSGATAGTIDKYYLDPVSGRRFRSKVEILYYLETGTVRKKRARATENSEGDINSSEGSRIQKNKKPGTSTSNSALDFDFAHPPDSAVWVLSNADEETWTPFIGGKLVPEREQQRWSAAFASLNTPNYGEKKS